MTSKDEQYREWMNSLTDDEKLALKLRTLLDVDYIKAGFQAGFERGRATAVEGEFERGNTTGYYEGYREGHSEGREEGYEAGYADAEEATSNWRGD